MPLVTRKQKPLTGRFAEIDAKFEKFFIWLENKYRNAVRKVLKHKFIVIGFLSLLLIVSIILIPIIGWEFMPQQEEDNVNISATLPMGTPLAETEAVLKQLELIVKKEVNSYERIVLSAGGGGMMGMGGNNSNTGSLRINLKKYSERTETANQIKENLRPYFNQFPGVIFYFGGGMRGGMMGGGSTVDIVLRTDNWQRAKL